MDYKKVNLHYLRAFAREIGVKSPCTLKKDDLIKSIQKIERREVEPVFSKVGRPLGEKIICEKKERKFKSDSEEKQLLFFVIDRFRSFLNKLEKEIEDKFL